VPDHNYFSGLIWDIADLLRGPYRPPQYERVMLPMTVLRRFDCVLAPSKDEVLAIYQKRKDGKVKGDALDGILNAAAGQRFHNRSPLEFEKLKGDPDNIAQHLTDYIGGFSANVRRIFDYFEFTAEIEKMSEANLTCRRQPRLAVGCRRHPPAPTAWDVRRPDRRKVDGTRRSRRFPRAIPRSGRGYAGRKDGSRSASRCHGPRDWGRLYGETVLE